MTLPQSLLVHPVDPNSGISTSLFGEVRGVKAPSGVLFELGSEGEPSLFRVVGRGLTTS